jgi:hypothetical protein
VSGSGYHAPPLPRIYWYEQRPGEARRLPPLAQDTQTEVVVVGGGVAGLGCAQTLAEKGRKVVLLERGLCAWARVDGRPDSSHRMPRWN